MQFVNQSTPSVFTSFQHQEISYRDKNT